MTTPANSAPAGTPTPDPDFTAMTPEQLATVAARYHAMLTEFAAHALDGGRAGAEGDSINIVRYTLADDGTFTAIEAETFYNRFDDIDYDQLTITG